MSDSFGSMHYRHLCHKYYAAESKPYNLVTEHDYESMNLRKPNTIYYPFSLYPHVRPLARASMNFELSS